MNLAMLPIRVAAGAFILNSGIGKLELPEEGAAQLQKMGASGVPQLEKLTPKQFGTFISATEIGVGGALLTPFVPGWLAGGALLAFSGGLLNMYLKTPGMTQEDGVRPTQEGTAVAKDVFLAGIGATLILNSLGLGKKKVKKVKAK